MTFKILVVFVKGVSDWAKKAVIEALNELKKELPEEYREQIEIHTQEVEMDERTLRWNKLKETKEFGPQYRSYAFTYAVPVERRKEYDKVIVLTHHDLGSEDLNFVFGSSFGEVQVLSYARIEKWYPKVKEEAVKILLLHELGHSFGCPPSNHPFIQYILGPHCAFEGCLMGQANVKREILNEEGKVIFRGFVGLDRHARDVMRRRKRTGSPFCKYCRDQIRSYFKSFFEKGKRPH